MVGSDVLHHSQRNRGESDRICKIALDFITV